MRSTIAIRCYNKFGNIPTTQPRFKSLLSWRAHQTKGGFMCFSFSWPNRADTKPRRIQKHGTSRRFKIPLNSIRGDRDPRRVKQKKKSPQTRTFSNKFRADYLPPDRGLAARLGDLDLILPDREARGNFRQGQLKRIGSLSSPARLNIILHQLS